jgi:DNA-binding transcriptional regulator YdaS (Cro superfamily)
MQENAIPSKVAGAAAAIKAVGGGSALARAVGVTRFAVNQWRTAGVPALRVSDVSRLTGIPLHELRPDIFPHPDAHPRARPQEAA